MPGGDPVSHRGAPGWKDARRGPAKRDPRPAGGGPSGGAGPAHSGRGGHAAPRPRQEDGQGVSTTLEDLKPVPVALGGTRGGPEVKTLRRDNWWRNPMITAVFLAAFVLYSTWAV